MSTIQKTSAQLKLYLLLKRVLQSLLIPVLFIAVWAVASAFHGLDPKLIPSPLQVLEKAGLVIQQENFLLSFAESLTRNVFGFVLGALLGVLFGV